MPNGRFVNIRFNAVKYNIDPMRVGMLGFSAGGYLTSTIGSLIKRVWFLPNYTPDEIDQMPDLPNLLILCYPVISLLSMPGRRILFQFTWQKSRSEFGSSIIH